MSANSIIKKSGSRCLKLSPDLQTLPPRALYYSIHVSTAIEFGIPYSTSDCIKLVGFFFNFFENTLTSGCSFQTIKVNSPITSKLTLSPQINTNLAISADSVRWAEDGCPVPCHLITINAALVVLNSEQLLFFGAKVSLSLSSQDGSVAGAVNTA